MEIEWIQLGHKWSRKIIYLYIAWGVNAKAIKNVSWEKKPQSSIDTFYSINWFFCVLLGVWFIIEKTQTVQGLCTQ